MPPASAPFITSFFAPPAALPPFSRMADSGVEVPAMPCNHSRFPWLIRFRQLVNRHRDASAVASELLPIGVSSFEGARICVLVLRHPC